MAPDISSEGGLRDRALLEMLYSTGMWVGELVALNDDHIDTIGLMVRVRGKAQRTPSAFGHASGASFGCLSFATRCGASVT